MPCFLMSYNLFKEEFIPRESVAGIKKLKPRVVYSKQRQTGRRISLEEDKKRKALGPGKRVSKRGKIYYEYRKSRTDLKGSSI